MATEVVTLFERIPEFFVRFYDAQFQAWGRNFRRVGTRAQIRFARPLEPSLLSMDQRRIVGVILEAEVAEQTEGRTVVVVRPSNDAAEDAILRHVRELEREVLH